MSISNNQNPLANYQTLSDEFLRTIVDEKKKKEAQENISQFQNYLNAVIDKSEIENKKLVKYNAMQLYLAENLHEQKINIETSNEIFEVSSHLEVALPKNFHSITKKQTQLKYITATRGSKKMSGQNFDEMNEYNKNGARIVALAIAKRLSQKNIRSKLTYFGEAMKELDKIENQLENNNIMITSLAHWAATGKLDKIGALELITLNSSAMMTMTAVSKNMKNDDEEIIRKKTTNNKSGMISAKIKGKKLEIPYHLNRYKKLTDKKIKYKPNEEYFAEREKIGKAITEEENSRKIAAKTAVNKKKTSLVKWVTVGVMGTTTATALMSGSNSAHGFYSYNYLSKFTEQMSQIAQHITHLLS